MRGVHLKYICLCKSFVPGCTYLCIKSIASSIYTAQYVFRHPPVFHRRRTVSVRHMEIHRTGRSAGAPWIRSYFSPGSYLPKMACQYVNTLYIPSALCTHIHCIRYHILIRSYLKPPFFYPDHNKRNMTTMCHVPDTGTDHFLERGLGDIKKRKISETFYL